MMQRKIRIIYLLLGAIDMNFNHWWGRFYRISFAYNLSINKKYNIDIIDNLQRGRKDKEFLKLIKNKIFIYKKIFSLIFF